MKQNNNNNEAWLEWLRVIATIAVIILHCVADPLNNYGITDDANWFASLVLRNIVAVLVPLFFMMSGYLYLRKPELNVMQFFRKRMVKIVAPLLLWSYFYVAYAHGFRVGELVWSDALLPFKQPAMYNLWFMYPLIGLYLALPLIHSLVRNLNPQMRLYALIYWLVAVGVADYLMRFTGVSLAVAPQFITIWVGYFIAGYLIISYNFKPKMLAAMCVAIYSVMIIGTYALTCAAQPTPSHMPPPSQMYELSTAHMMLLAAAMFWLAHNYQAHFKPSRMIALLSERSYMVYLIHPLLMMQADKLLFGDAAHLPWFYLPAIICLTIFCSYGLAILVRALRLNKLLG